MSNDDLIFRMRVALFAHAERVGVSQACRDFGVHRSTYYRWRPRVKQWGVDALRPRERRKPLMPNQVPAWVEERVVAFPGFGPRRIAAELQRERWQCTVISPSPALVPKLSALKRDLEAYLRYYNEGRVHTGRFTRGRIPADIVFPKNKILRRI